MLSWVEIRAAALEHNIAELRRLVGTQAALGVVVKANAYGHGLLEVARIAARAGVQWFCVNSLEEALRLRRAGYAHPILVMGYVERAALAEVVRHELRPVIYNLETLQGLEREAAKQERVMPVHLKLETGTHRQGIPEPEIPPFLEKLGASSWLRLEGLATHFANIEDTTDHSYALQQMDTFERLAEMIEARWGPVPLRHSACSAAALLFPRTRRHLVRIGIALYGLWPSRETYVSCQDRADAPELRPVLAWKARIAQVKDVPEGAFIGYGCTYRTTRPSRIAVVPVGYHEGYDRGLSGVAHVLVRGRRAPVRGRICMNMCMVDVTDIPSASLEDEVVLLGEQGAERVTVEQLASWCGTIAHEIVARIHPDVPRRIV